VESPLQPVPSIGLGSNAVSPLDMASAYATIAAGGIYSEPMAITKVELANGKVDTDAGWGKPQRERVVADWVAAEVTDVLEQNMLHGTGVGAYFGRTSAGKTGTTDNYADAWFCGYVPQLVGTVWVGYPRAEIPMLNVHGIAVSGPTFPAQIWRYFMESAVGPMLALEFRVPSGVPEWISWHGQYQYGGSSASGSDAGAADSGSAPAADTGATTTTTAVSTSEPAPESAPTPAPTPEPVPATTSPAPPPDVVTTTTTAAQPAP
jgi:penicillin-binding protein 1A